MGIAKCFQSLNSLSFYCAHGCPVLDTGWGTRQRGWASLIFSAYCTGCRSSCQRAQARALLAKAARPPPLFISVWFWEGWPMRISVSSVWKRLARRTSFCVSVIWGRGGPLCRDPASPSHRSRKPPIKLFFKEFYKNFKICNFIKLKRQPNKIILLIVIINPPPIWDEAG